MVGSSGSAGGRHAGGAAAATPAGFISRYQILEKIGEGGMGSLYLARDPAIDRLVVIKLLRRGFDTPELRERFAREARAAGRLRHPNIVTIFDVGEHNGDPFIAMEFLAGETLDQLIRHGARLSLGRRLKLIEELCEGLAYAHRAGIVHRDVKPANLMVDSEGIVKILDFGIVRLDDAGGTQSGVMVGTVNYMSPEQVVGSGVDSRSDIFAVGLVAYELLSSRQAFPGTLKDGLLNRILNGSPEPLASLVPNLDPEVIAIVEQAMRRDPAERYPDLARMRNDIVRVRQRIEAAEDRAVDNVAADSGETMVATSPVPTPAMGTGSKSSPAIGTGAKSSPALEAAQRALESGDYRTALTLAGRSAAADPHDRAASGIMSRAQAGLLERGRSLESSAAAPVPSSGAVASGPVVTPSPAATAAPPAEKHLRVAPAIMAAIAVVVITLAGLVLYLMKATPSEPAPAAAGSQAPATVSQPPAVTPPATLRAEGPAPATQPADRPVTPQTPPEAEPAAARQSAARNPATRGASTPAGRPNPALTPRGGSPVPAEPAAAPAAPEPPPIARVGRDGVAVPRRIATAEPQYPPAALAARTRATVKLELTIGREGRVADARVVTSAGNGFDQAALAAARRWEFAPTYVDGKPVPVIYPVDVDFVPPEPEPAPAATKPAAPAAATPPPSTQPSAPAARPAINDQALIVQALKQYEAAWEALDADALARVQVLSSSEAAAVRRTMADAENYSMDVVVQNITIDPKGQAATVRATVTRNFRAKAFNRSERVALPTTMQLQKRGDSWVITGMR